MKNFEISDILTNTNLNIRNNILFASDVQDLLDLMDLYDVDFNVYLPDYSINLQRDYVWIHIQQDSLIKSILKGIQLPSIAMIKYRNDKKIEIIDGKQRLITIIKFIRNEFPIIVGENEYYYSDLLNTPTILNDGREMDVITRYFRLDLMSNIVTVNKISDVPDEEKIKWFNMINFSGTEQEKSHMDLLNSKINR